MKKIIYLFSVIICLMVAYAQADSSGVVNMNDKVAGQSLPEYANLWWQWANSMPASESPVRDLTGLKCDVNQNGPVWFLAGGYGSSKISRKCSIPKDKYVFFPVINMMTFPGKGANLNCEKAKAQVAMNNDNLRSFVVTIDDQKLVNPAFHRYSSPECFDLFGWPAKTVQLPRLYPAATEGYWVMLKPLSIGVHKIKFSAEYHNPGEAYGLMVQDIEYEIDIIESSKTPPRYNLIEEKGRTIEQNI